MAFKLVLDARWLQHPMHGIGRYTMRLLEHLPLRAGDQVFVLYCQQDFSPQFLKLNRASMTWIAVKSPLFSLGDFREIRAVLRHLQPDLIHFPGFWKPLQVDFPWVMTLHDLIHLRPPVALKYRLYYKNLQQRQILQAKHVFTVSHASSRALKAWQPDLESKLNVTYLGIDKVSTSLLSETVSEKNTVSNPYFLYVGNEKPHKNTALLFVAMKQCLQRIKGNGYSPELVTVGLSPTNSSWHKAFNNVSDAELQTLYAGATAVLMPSFEEGFGIPLLEAMSHQKPILAADIAVFREVLNGSGLCLKANEPSLWGRAMSAFFKENDPFIESLKACQRRIPDNVKRFDWNTMAEETYRTYLNCVAGQ